MQIDSLKLLNFRNYDHLEIIFHKHLNIFYGKNGSGKSNLVEAIYVLSITRSFRNVEDKILIKQGTNLSKVEGNLLEQSKYHTNYRVLLSKDGKKVKINQAKISKLSEYISKIPIVLFHPDDLRFIKDTPGTRRKYLNISISQYSINYLKNLSIYNRLLKQRNSYLKSMSTNGNHSYDYLAILTEKLVQYGIKVFEERRQFLKDINSYLENFYLRITGIAGLKLNYESDYQEMDFNHLLKLYEKNFSKDLSFGKTNLGIHTDDVKFTIDKLNLKDFGSEGQQKNALIAYKFSEMEFLKQKNGHYPIFILDDLFSELDREKINCIFQLLKEDMQIFITMTDMELFYNLPLHNYKSYEISNGDVVEEMEYE